MRPNDEARWIEVAASSPEWDERSEILARFIPEGASVLDLGAGAQGLRTHLAPGSRYQPVDLVPGPDVLLCDFNAGQWPELEQAFDVAVGAGLLEYVLDTPAFLAGLPDLARSAILTYAPRTARETRALRSRRGWVTHLSVHELRGTLDQAGYPWRVIAEWRGQLVLALDLATPDRRLRLASPTPTAADRRWQEQYEALGNAAADDAWVAAQRRSWKAAKLERSRAQLLQQTPGWEWEPDEAENRIEPVAGDDSASASDDDLSEWVATRATGSDLMFVGLDGAGIAEQLADAGHRVLAVRDGETHRSDPKPGIAVIAAPPTDLPAERESFDTVVAAGVLSRDADPLPCLREIVRVLRPGGRLVVIERAEPDVETGAEPLLLSVTIQLLSRQFNVHDAALIEGRSLVAADLTTVPGVPDHALAQALVQTERRLLDALRSGR